MFCLNTIKSIKYRTMPGRSVGIYVVWKSIKRNKFHATVFELIFIGFERSPWKINSTNPGPHNTTKSYKTGVYRFITHKKGNFLDP